MSRLIAFKYQKTLTTKRHLRTKKHLRIGDLLP
jgi:hypothetical protein